MATGLIIKEEYHHVPYETTTWWVKTRQAPPESFEFANFHLKSGTKSLSLAVQKRGQQNGYLGFLGDDIS